MKITIVSSEKTKQNSLLEIENDYIKRLRGWEVSFAAQPKVGDFVIALDEKGENLSSQELANKIDKLRLDAKKLSFIIGGADGLTKEQRQITNYYLSFGKLTWPHKFVRVLLCEQIYRVWSILNNHPYHRA